MLPPPKTHMEAETDALRTWEAKLMLLRECRYWLLQNSAEPASCSAKLLRADEKKARPEMPNNLKTGTTNHLVRNYVYTRDTLGKING